MKKDLGVAPWIVEAILGHAQEKLIETYMPSAPLSLMRDALDAWSHHLAGVLKAEGKRGRQTRKEAIASASDQLESKAGGANATQAVGRSAPLRSRRL